MKTVVITGSTRGIGFGLASEFLKRDCNVMICGRSQESVDRAMTQLHQSFPKAQIGGRPCDITDFAQVQALWDAAVERFGRVDIWINNAALNSPIQPLWEQGADALKTILDANILGTIYGCNVAIVGMQAQGGGHIYTMEGFGSGGEQAFGNAPYGSSKYAVRYLTKSLINETKKRTMAAKISTLSPGIVPTDLLMMSIAPGREAQTKRIFNILADKVETVTPYLVERILANDRAGAQIRWLNGRKIAMRFLLSPFNKRDLFAVTT